MFLLIIWGFHIMHLDHTYFPVLPDLLPILVNPPQIRKRKQKNAQVQFELPIYLFPGAWSNSQ